MELLAEQGFTGMSMENVARRAGVGKDTLYRRWPSKVDLVSAAIRRMAEVEVKAPESGRLEEDLRPYLRSIVRLLTKTDFGRVLAGLVGEAGRNPELGEEFRSFWRTRRATAKRVVTEESAPAIDRDVLIDLLVGAIYFRHLMSKAPLTNAYVDDLVRAAVVLTDVRGKRRRRTSSS
jgi:AcrR family transcriptional regulator